MAFTSMKTVKVDFDWDNPSVEENFGHIQSEWGNGADKKDPEIIFAYKMKWE